MTINLLARGTTAPPLRPGHRRWLLTVPGLAGLCYTLSWIAGLAVPAPSPGFGASGAGIVAALSGHGPALAAQYTLTEGQGDRDDGDARGRQALGQGVLREGLPAAGIA